MSYWLPQNTVKPTKTKTKTAIWSAWWVHYRSSIVATPTDFKMFCWCWQHSDCVVVLIAVESHFIWPKMSALNAMSGQCPLDTHEKKNPFRIQHQVSSSLLTFQVAQFPSNDEPNSTRQKFVDAKKPKKNNLHYFFGAANIWIASDRFEIVELLG